MDQSRQTTSEQLYFLQQAPEKLVEEGGETQAADDGEDGREQNEQRGEESNNQGKHDG